MRTGYFSNKAVLAAVLAAGMTAAPARAQEADVLHWWTSGGESKAVGVFADAFERQGGTWIDSAVVGGEAARAAAMNRIAGGNPPTAMQWNIGVAVHTLADEGLLANFDDLAGSEGWKDVLPPLVVENIVRDGHFVAIPVDIHATNWLWYNKKMLDELGLA
ncbi:MAG TPA: ABC transporter substrate-binding protein, partial [Arenibaculum sp.]|nr:ABC transporter substrate-binding protein [Arenibaculum sp.]